MNGLKKVFANKNTVTVVGIVAVIFILYFAYNWRVNQAINPITVPFARELIKPGTQIKESMIGTRQVSASMQDENLITNISDVIDKYANADTVIPQGSLFYKRQVVEKEQLPGNIILNIKKGYVLYNMPVNTETTYGNSIYPGNYIDIYMKIVKVNGIDASGNVLTTDAIQLGRFISNVKVIAVMDGSGAPVFSNLDERKTPSMVIFAVPEEYFILLTKAKYLGNYQATLIPVPTNESLKDNPGDVNITSEGLKNYINQITVWRE